MAKKQELTSEELLAEALVREEDWPYRVPGNWVWVRLGSVTEVIMGQSPKGQDTTDDDSYIGLIGGAADMGELYPKVSRYTMKPTKISQINDVIISIRATLGRPIISNGEYCLGRGVAAIHSNLLTKEFILFYILNFENKFYEIATGTTFAQISKINLENMSFPLPPLAEQQRIVDRIESLFDKLDQAKDLIQEALDSFENRKAAILHQAFTGELTKMWREAHGVGMESWEEKPLKDISVIISGNAFKSQDFDASYEVPCVKITNVGVGYYYDNNNNRLPGSYLNEYNRFLVKSDDILISLTRSFINKGLKVCIYPNGEEALLNQRVAIIRYNSTNYLYYYLRTEAVLNFVKKKSKTTNQPNLSINDLKNLFVPIPSKHEQQKIVRILDDLFEKEQNAKDLCDLIDQIEAMKKTILGKAFRGDLGTNEAGEESAVELLKQALMAK